MTRKGQLTLGVAAALTLLTAVLLTTGLLWLKHRVSRDLSGNEDAVDSASASTPSSESLSEPVAPQTKPAAAEPTPAPALQNPPERVPKKPVVDPATRQTVVAVMGELKALYGDAGTLSWDEAKALIAKRQQAAQNLTDKLAALGPGGARAMADVYSAENDTRNRLLLVAALGRIDDQEASAALANLMGQDNSFSLRKEIVAALGKRQEPASGAALTDILQNQSDARLRAVSVQALSLHPEALPVLAERIANDTDQNVRMESIRSVGLIGGSTASDILTGIAKSTMDTNFRQAAIQELGRSFGQALLPVFQGLLGDPNESIRQSAAKSIARFGQISAPPAATVPPTSPQA